MGSLFRSESMTSCQLFLQSEASYNCVSELGSLGLVEFKDLNADINAFQRRFVNEIRRCDEMERKLRFLDKEIKKECVAILDFGDNPDAPHPKEMAELESTFEKLENELKDVNKNADALKRTYTELLELKQILNKTKYFFDEVEDKQRRDSLYSDDTTRILPEEGKPGSGKLGFVAGVIRRDRLMAFERMLWRVCRGNVFIRQKEIESPLEDSATGELTLKSVILIFFQGDHLRSKVKKICEGFRASLYPCPEEASDRREMTGNVVSRIEDLNTVLVQTTEHRHRILLASAKNLKNWFIKVWKMKAIYHTMNMFNFDLTQKCLIAECWCPTDELDTITTALRIATEKSGSSVPSIVNRMDTSEQPPTFNRTNKVTVGFQAIVDAYGVANYKEVNPAPFTIITFPFLFAVMFGDAGHGVLMLLFALWMVIKEKSLTAMKSNNEIWLTFFNGRYIILLMGMFSIYTGMIYNDVFAKSLNLFGSSFRPPFDPEPLPGTTGPIYGSKTYGLNPINDTTGSPYPFGMDPIWQLSENKILFLNSYKMKVSVILGVMQMLFGVVLSVWNHLNFKQTTNIWFEFVPQVVFLMSIFGYMNGMIVAKWFLYDSSISSKAPSVLINLINMFLMKYPDDATTPEFLKTWYPGQRGVQTVLLILALLCVPWMLVLKPWYLNRQNKRQNQFVLLQKRHSESGERETSILVEDQEEHGQEEEDTHAAHKSGGHGGHDGPFDLGDVIIHQAIHTIEYCLGSISHTASYLRLWALSLAHAQLSEVLWNMVMKNGLSGITSSNLINGIIMFPVFAFWATLTVSVLLVMEGLSAFLHALRLHWVEFQSKFYTGAGILFQPFSFKAIIDVAEMEVAAVEAPSS